MFWSFYHYPSIGIQTILILHFLSDGALKGLFFFFFLKQKCHSPGPPAILI